MYVVIIVVILVILFVLTFGSLVYLCRKGVLPCKQCCPKKRRRLHRYSPLADPEIMRMTHKGKFSFQLSIFIYKRHWISILFYFLGSFEQFATVGPGFWHGFGRDLRIERERPCQRSINEWKIWRDPCLKIYDEEEMSTSPAACTSICDIVCFLFTNIRSFMMKNSNLRGICKLCNIYLMPIYNENI